MMKRLLLILLLFNVLAASAQQYNNEWIDYSKTYYKFKVGSNGLYRIPQSVLVAANLAATDVTHFKLWRNGKEVPFYTPTASGPLTAGGYIEFWGEANDGKPDQDLYRTPTDQINNSKSLFTDTAAYFLTVNTAGGNRRLAATGNMIPPGAIAEPYFMHTAGIFLNESIHLGPYLGAVSEAAISASFEVGEGWTSNEIVENQTRNVSFTSLFPFTGSGAPAMQLNLNVVGNSPSTRSLRMLLNGAEVFNTPLNGFSYSRLSTTLPVSNLTGNTETVAISNISVLANNRMKVGSVELTYPRAFNFGGTSSFRFSVPGGTEGRYLEISGFNYSGTPLLYDLSNGKRYEVDISNPSLLKVYVQPGDTHDLVLVSTAGGNIKTIAGLETRNFVNYEAAANQGDYLMITHQNILNGSNGAKPVEEYRTYRSTAAGGGYNARIYLIDQLTDQFAFGIKYHPLAVRNFLRLARNKFASQPKSVFIIGKGVKYTAARYNESSPVTERLNLIPTFGEPASDVLLAAEGSNSAPLTPIGRVPVINGDELSIYLQKVKQYEQHLIPVAGVEASAWKKDVIHMVGADDQSLIDLLYGYLTAHKTYIEDTLYGAAVFDFVKSSTPGSEQSTAERLKGLINSGINLLTYFGHSSSSSLAFNLEDPANYANHGKYPVFHMMGCNVGDIFILDANRVSSFTTISERYLFAQERGSIGMMAGTSFGYVAPLQQYNENLYKVIAKEGYATPLGALMQKTIENVYISSGQDNLFTRAQCEEFTLNGDPAIRLYQYNKPDYAIEDAMVTVNPGIISVSDPFFTVKAKIANLGKAINRDLIVEAKRIYPDQSTSIIRRDTIPGIRNSDSITYQINIDPAIDKGANKIAITLDPENQTEELFETNNTITKDIFIYEDDIKAVYPYNNAIVNTQNVVLAASTGNPFAPSRQYVMEMDTTVLFNSAAKISQTKTSAGGVIEFAPGINFRDSTVYYWRVAASGDPLVWNTAAFTYKAGAAQGYSQSHVYQFDNSINTDISVAPSGVFSYDSLRSIITINHCIYTFPFTQRAVDFSLQIDDRYKQAGFISSPSGNPQMNSLRFYLVDNKTLTEIKNVDMGATGRYGSYRPLAWNASSVLGFFQFDISTVAARKTVMAFLDSIPTGYYVALTSNQWESAILPSVWQSDTTTLGKNVSLYHKLKAIGFSGLDSVQSEVPYVFVYQKGKAQPLAQVIGKTISEKQKVDVSVPISGTTGVLKSSLFGKARSWSHLVWDGFSLENPSTDNVFISVAGVDRNGVETMLIGNIPVSQKTAALSAINADVYPGLRVSMQSTDTANRSPYQLRYWRAYGVPVAEGAIAPNLYYTPVDTLEVGAPLNMGIAFKNVSDHPFDSIQVKLTVRDKNNVESVIPIPKLKPLQVKDTVRLNVSVNTKAFVGSNLAYLEFNAGNNAQAEQHQFNNFVSRNFYVRGDTTSPYLDVTFDGSHILNRDIVSSKPHILMKLTDDARYLLLNNTDLVKVQLRHPGGTVRNYSFNNDTLILTPPDQGGNNSNTATITFKPHLLEDGDYELIVSAKDQSGNSAGKIDYRVAFQVINKPMISNLLNYPNPFTTSTAFVFTLTGSEIPQNIRIQILTVTGKIVREITRAELGPLRIGRNITEFKWDGTDQYGQKLANGVYLYRVLTNLNGKALDKYKASGDNTDKYFNKGYGKMVLIR